MGRERKEREDEWAKRDAESRRDPEKEEAEERARAAWKEHKEKK